MNTLSSIEICAGAGGQALGLEMAGFNHLALIEIDNYACKTLKANRPNWNVIEADLKHFDASAFFNIDLLAGGVPCPPFSVAGNQLGENDERNLFPEVIRLVNECRPKAVMIENVKGLMDEKFTYYRNQITNSIQELGYVCHWNLLNACNFGVSQHRQRTIFVALKEEYASGFAWPIASNLKPKKVGELLATEMGKNGWERAEEWSLKANAIAPTIVGGSKKHGGPDLGPTRAKKAWADLGVNGNGIADEPPQPGFDGLPKLTVAMAALLQGFPPDWVFFGKKTPAYRQVGNAFPPPVAKAVGEAIAVAISAESKQRGVA